MPTLNEISTWLTTSEAAREIGISKQAVHGLLDHNRIRAVRTHAGWLLDPDAVEEYRENKERRSGVSA